MLGIDEALLDFRSEMAAYLRPALPSGDGEVLTGIRPLPIGAAGFGWIEKPELAAYGLLTFLGLVCLTGDSAIFDVAFFLGETVTGSNTSTSGFVSSISNTYSSSSYGLSSSLSWTSSRPLISDDSDTSLPPFYFFKK